jgi:autotransporter-associated beta strand protein
VAALGRDPTGGSSFAFPTAEAKTLGLLAANGNSTDGIFKFGDGYNYSFDPNNVGSQQIDFNGVASHELTEIMGRIAGLGADFGNGAADYLPFDLMRFTAPGVRSVSTGNGAYFSVDNGITDLKNFNNSIPNGGDPQDWASGTNDSFNAFTSSGVKNPVTAVDYEAMDVLGYNNVISVVYSGFTGGFNKTQNANWGGSTLNFSGAAYADGNQAIFGDTDANGNAVTSSSVIIQSDGVSPAVTTFTNSSVSYTFSTSGSLGITGNGAVVLAGKGAVNFSSLNTYSGGTVITSGTLRANNGFAGGSATGNGTVTINGGTLGGNGTVTGPVVMTEGSITAGGNTTTPGKLAVTGVSTISGGTGYIWKINNGNGAAGSTNGWDDVTSSALTFTGLSSSLPFTITLESFNGSTAGTAANTSTGSKSWIIAESGANIPIDNSTYGNSTMLTGSNAGALSGLFVLNTSSFTVNGTSVPSSAFTLELVTDSGGQALEINYTAAPEPGSVAMALAALIPSLAIRRRRAIRR